MNKSKTGFYQRLIAHVVIWGAFAGYMLALSGFFFSPLKWPIGGVFNIGFVYAWIVVFVLAIAHLFIHKPTSIVFLVFLALGSIPFSNSFSVKTSGSFSEKKIQESIRIMQWNCEDLGGNLSWYTEEVIGRKRAEGFIKKFEPDIICLQDYSESRGKIYKSNNAFLKDTLGYAYSADALQSVQIKQYGVIRSGLKIVSKYPISAQGIIYYKGLTFPEAILWADVTVNEKKLRVVTTHFRSFYLNADKAFIQYMPTSLKEDAQVIEGKNIFKKLA
ncbi:MAG: hypothetical protein MUE99_08220, partial [Chitinophagaceae bacterium]|nr:hypothetical protein [Chitinophagaceae bacterium]